MKYILNIHDFSALSGVHFYGHVRREDGKHMVELDQPDGYYSGLSDAEKSRTIRFSNELAVVRRAKEWFEHDPAIQPGDVLVVWRGHFSKLELADIAARRRA